MTTEQPEALRLAEMLEQEARLLLKPGSAAAAAELRRQHARITELEVQLSAIGAGGVSPLMNAAQEATHLRELAAYRLTVENLEREIAAQQPAPSPVPSKPIGYLNPKVIGPDGKIDAPGALTYSSRPCGGWTFPIYAAAPTALTAQADTQPADYPPLPSTYYLVAGEIRGWDEHQMRAYVDADRAARAPADSVQEDAARYRWLAEHCRSTSEHWGGRWSIIIDGPAPKSHDSEDDFDAAIDAAMAANGGNK